MSTHVVIPVRNQLPLTQSICGQLLDQPGWDRAWIFDNGSTDGTADWLRGLDDRFTVVDAPGWGIYDMWDVGLRLAQGQAGGPVNVAILNNDVRLALGTLAALSAALRADSRHWIAYPNYDRPLAEDTADLGTRATRGTYRHGGMAGFCFMLAAEHIDWAPLVDPQFRWWGGDDDIAFTVEARGGLQVRVEGLPVEHLQEGTARHHDLGDQKGADLAAVLAKWGR